MENKEWFRFTTEKAYGILIYYGILFLISLFLSLTGVLNETFFTTFSMTEKALIAGVAATAQILLCGLLAARYNRPAAREVIA